MSDDSFPVTLTIPLPSYIPRARGIHAVAKFGTMLKAKCTQEEYNHVDQAADMLSISKSEFIRWVTTYAAKEVMKGALDVVRKDAD